MIATIVSVIVRMLASTTPIALAGVGGIFGERSGIVNIGLEGTMLFSAFAAVIGSFYTGSAWVGLLCAVTMGVLVSVLHSFLCINVKIDHNVSGLAINIAAANMTLYMMSLLFGSKGTSPAVTKLPSVSIPLLSDIPGAGEIFREMSIFTLLVPVVVLLAHYLLYKTDFGLRVLAVGENPKAAHSLGISVNRTQYMAVMIGGFCCGLAGAFLSISYLGMFQGSMTASRGFIAIATILVGRYRPAGVMLAGLLFGFAEAMQIALQGTVQIPNQIIECIPYVLTILVVIGGEISYRRRKMRIAEIH